MTGVIVQLNPQSFINHLPDSIVAKYDALGVDWFDFEVCFDSDPMTRYVLDPDAVGFLLRLKSNFRIMQIADVVSVCIDDLQEAMLFKLTWG